MNALRGQKIVSSGFLPCAVLSAATFLLATAFSVAAQVQKEDSCIHRGIADSLEKRLSQQRTLSDKSHSDQDADLAKQVVRAAEEFSDNDRAAAVGTSKPIAPVDSQIANLRSFVCRVLQTAGLPTNDSFGPAAVAAFFYVVSRVLTPSEILEIYPVITKAYNDKLISPSPQLAALVDRTRLALGRKQLFGTQAFVNDDLLVLAPLEKPEEVDRRRNEFGLEPLRQYEKSLQRRFRLPLIRSFQLPENVGSISEPSSKPANGALPFESSSDEPEIRINTALVKIDVLVRNAVSQNATQLKKEDFRVFDNGRPVEIEFFGRRETPFDIVLLLDLSGSTSSKIGLIKKSTKRFIEAKRPEDRVAIVAFTDKTTLVSDFESDRDILAKRIKEIGGFGGSFVWDAFWYAMDLLSGGSNERRKAIVALTDGLDNQFWFSRTDAGSKTGFADLAERVSRENVVIFPVYLDTESEYPRLKDSYRAARAALRYLADASGGNFYTAKKLEAVESLYDDVLLDVGAIYTLGFSPEIREGDQLWHSLKIDMPSRPELRIKYRPGYFAR